MRLLTLRSILLTTDLGESSKPAIRTAVEIARLAGADLHVLHVEEGEADRRPTHTDAAALVLDGQLRQAGASLEVIANAAVLQGAPASTIVEHAARVDSDVVVFGPHQNGAPSQSGLGSTADHVVRSAGVPCLVLPRELALPLERVLCPIDLSETARGALAVALCWAAALRRPGAEVEIRALHVDPETPASGADGLADEIEQARAQAGTWARVAIQPERVPSSDVAGTILQRAHDDAVDLLVLGTRGMGSDGEGGMGSVSSAVVCRADRPVLLVPPNIGREYAADPLP